MEVITGFFSMLFTGIANYFKNYMAEAMNDRENQFTLTSLFDLDYSDGLLGTMLICFVLSCVVIIFSSDSFKLKLPLNFLKEKDPYESTTFREGFRDWREKFNVVKVIIFAAVVFSLHSFYKSYIQIVGMYTQDDYTVYMASALGSYLNPFTILLVAAGVCEADLRRKKPRGQAGMLAASVFILPTLMLMRTLTSEFITLLVVGLILSMVASRLYKKGKVTESYLILSAIWLVGKFFMLSTSEEVCVMAGTLEKRLRQFVVCEKADFLLTAILFLALFGYNYMTTNADRYKKKRVVIPQIVIAVVMLVAVGLSGILRADAYAGTYGIGYLEKHNTVEEAAPVAETAETQKIRKEELLEVNPDAAEASSSLHSSKTGVVYDIKLTLDGDLSTCWQDGKEEKNEQGDGIGETLTYSFGQEVDLCTVEICNGSHSKDGSYEKNNRLAEVRLHYYQDGNEVGCDTMTLEDDATEEFQVYRKPEGIRCDGVVIEIVSVYSGTSYHDTCVTEVQFRHLVEVD